MYQDDLLDVENRSIRAQSTEGKTSHSKTTFGPNYLLPCDNGIEACVVQSTLDDFSSIICIPETPPPSESGGEIVRVSGDWPAETRQGTKRKRMESIRSVGDEETTSFRSVTECLETEETEAQRSSSSWSRSNRTPEASITTKLKPLPPGAPRVIEKKGRYTLRKGIRIRDYKIPNPDSVPYPPSPDSPEYQCRDGFNKRETSLGYPQPMVAQMKEVRDPEVVSVPSLQRGSQRSRAADRETRSPSLGTRGTASNRAGPD
ncbi:hypothetical protein FDECE_18321 [Fusarium decemcellulare]|nr:hypothetical protein FDECE_18321 [Fusarium decemcellulare]